MTSKVAVLGAGNAGRAMAAYLTLRGVEVRLYNRWPNEIEDIERGVIRVSGWTNAEVAIATVTTDLEVAVQEADVIIFVVPAFAHQYLAESIAPLINSDQAVLVHPGLVGGALAVKHALSSAGVPDALVGETVTSVFASRLRPGGVHIRQVLESVALGVVPKHRTGEFLAKVQAPFENRFRAASNVLETSMNNRNPVYHCPTMLTNLARSEAGEDWAFADVVTPTVVNLITGVDKERVALAERMGVTAPTFYDSLVQRIGFDTGSLLEQIRATYLPGGASPLPTSPLHRYVSEDVPFGLIPWIRLGKWFGTPVGTMTSVATALAAATGRHFEAEALTLSKLGIHQNEDPQAWLADI